MAVSQWSQMAPWNFVVFLLKRTDDELHAGGIDSRMFYQAVAGARLALGAAALAAHRQSVQRLAEVAEGAGALHAVAVAAFLGK